MLLLKDFVQNVTKPIKIKTIMKKIILIVAIVTTFIAIFFVVKNRTITKEVLPDTKIEQKQKVAATIFPLYDITRTIAGDKFEVVLLTPPGASPHSFEPQPSVLKKLTGSKVIFAIGHGVDNWTEKITNSLEIPVLLVEKNIPLLESKKDIHTDKKENDAHANHKDKHDEYQDNHDEHKDKKEDRHNHGTTDPHYWLSTKNAEQIAFNIAEELAVLDADNADIYLKRAVAYQKELKTLRMELQKQMELYDNRNVVVLHDAWNYFADEFGLNIVGSFKSLVGENPSPKHLAHLGKEVQDKNISIIFVEPQLSSSIIKAFAQDNNLGIAIMDPLGGVFERTTYIDLIRYNLKQIINSLKK